MEIKRLIPYSVHLPEEIYKKLKLAAGERKASALVRDAITLIIEGDDAFNGGYNKAISDVINTLYEDEKSSTIGFLDEKSDFANGEVNMISFAEHIESLIEPMRVPQNVKNKFNAKSKKA
jgi:hypothetical protein